MQPRLRSAICFGYCCTTILNRNTFVKGLLTLLVPNNNMFPSQKARTTENDSPSSSPPPLLRVLLHGGDNMLGRATQLTFPIQAPGEEMIKDSCTAAYYLDLCLNHPPVSSPVEDVVPDIDEIRRRNANHGSYMWGDTLGMKIYPQPNLRLLNLETAVTKSIHNTDIPRKGINYHMHIDNYENIMTGFILGEKHTADDLHYNKDPSTATATTTISPVIVNCANNHGIDYGRRALDEETLPYFRRLNSDPKLSPWLQTIGLGKNLGELSKPVVLAVDCHISPGTSTDQVIPVKVEMYAFSTECSGTPRDWWATDSRSGLFGLPKIYTTEDVDTAMELVKPLFSLPDTKDLCFSIDSRQNEKPNILRIVSIHWGPNWAMKGEDDESRAARQTFAHRLIDECHVDLIYGHSSHHARGIEVYKGKLILYGAGDIINDYEGFENAGEERYNRLGGIYVVDTNPLSANKFQQLRIFPMFMNRLRLERATTSSAIWRPQQQRLVNDPQKIQEFCRFLNSMSALDTKGASGDALELEYVVSDEQIPGGPLLRSTARI